MTKQELRQRIIDALTAKPHTTDELRDAVGVGGTRLGNIITVMCKEGSISRATSTPSRYRYFIGLTSGQEYMPARAKPRKVTAYKRPVKVIDVSRCYFGDAAPCRVTLPAAPWEVHA